MAELETEQDVAIQVDTEKGNFKYPENYQYDAGVGLTEETIRYISKVKDEAPWLLDFRLNALKVFEKKKMPTTWADTDLENIEFDKRYYLSKGQQPRVPGKRCRTTSKKLLSVWGFLSKSGSSGRS